MALLVFFLAFSGAVSGDVAFRAAFKGIVEVGLSCPSYKLLRDSITLCKPDFPVADMPTGKILKVINAYTLNQREGYTVGHKRNEFGNNSRVINTAHGQGCGLCLIHIYRNGPRDLLGTVVELKNFFFSVMCLEI